MVMQRKRVAKGAATMQLGEILIAVMMLMFFVLLLTSALSAFSGTEQGVVKLNAELLRSKLGEACSFGKSSIDRLSFPQGTPYPTAAHRAIDIPGFLPRAYIKVTGDPKYVIYYETFPIGEAVGWEVYHDFDYRIIAPFDNGQQSGNQETFENKLYKNKDSYVAKVLDSTDKAGIKSSSKEPPKVIVNNIILTSELNPIPNEEPRQFTPKISRSGDWKFKTQENGNIRAVNGDNIFGFSSYSLLTSREQTSLKYRSCGDNYLCIKTPEGVERLRLPESCGNQKLEYIQLEYDNRNLLLGNIALGGAVVGAGVLVPKAALAIVSVSPIAAAKFAATAAGKGLIFAFTSPIKTAVISAAAAAGLTVATATAGYALGKFLSLFLSYKASDFYLASPCALNKVQIEKVSCDTLCKKWMKYPLYDVVVDSKGERRYEHTGDHYQCIENIEGAAGASMQGPTGSCLKVKVQSSPEGFCWTADPTKGTASGIFEKITNFETQAVASVFGFTPVKDSALYIKEPPAIALKPQEVSEGVLSATKDFVERRYTWSWPGGEIPQESSEGLKCDPLACPASNPNCCTA